MDGKNFWHAMLANISTTRTEIAHYADKYGYVSIQKDNIKYTKAQTVAEYYLPEVTMSKGVAEL